jgi:hypothetical protein
VAARGVRYDLWFEVFRMVQTGDVHSEERWHGRKGEVNRRTAIWTKGMSFLVSAISNDIPEFGFTS